MIFITIPIAIVAGLIIAKYYKPKSKSEKIWASILIPLIGGALIHLLVASCKNSGFGFAFDLGSTLLFVVIPEVALLITLLISLEVGGKKDWNDTSTIKLHYGTGENRVDFEVNLTQKEILQMAKMREQDPERWKDNELELVKLVKKEVETDGSIKIEKESKEEEPVSENNIENVEIENSDKIQNAENNGSPNVQIVENESLIEQTPRQSGDPEKEEEKGCLFGNKLESEYRREAVTNAHWIRQNGTEMCINIDDVTYQRMIELQNESPKKWVDNEFNLYLQAASGKKNGSKRKRKWKMKKWMWIVAIIIGLCAIYGIVARTVDSTIATCNEDMMHRVYQQVTYQGYVSCSYPVFRYRMIASSLYRKKMYNLYPMYPYQWKGQACEKPCDYENYVFNLHINKWIENPFVWLW